MIAHQPAAAPDGNDAQDQVEQVQIDAANTRAVDADTCVLEWARIWWVIPARPGQQVAIEVLKVSAR